MNKIYLKELYLTYPVEELFNDLTNGIVRSNHLNYIYYYNENDILIFQYNKKNDMFWCSYSEYWSSFYENFKLDRLSIEHITKDLIKNILN